MITQNELHEYSVLKERLQVLEKSLKTRLQTDEEIESGPLTASFEPSISTRPKYKEVVDRLIERFKGVKRHRAVMLALRHFIEESRQPHPTAPVLKVWAVEAVEAEAVKVA